ncbi:uncharacterized protein SCHCODRAFT_02097079 [Schizophyllum commune H4-8]|uniref:uncharacterized protein n=1 Tax=Schizophyllum commune (strain H4-8 / FGSC 9210) TaxID=578458 RepID=UPI00215EC89F|nr:uncharacterized protein SCHCODRAFT_02097079 [Schizophyllum commune H4-8]KAI5886388.1 hypothetical protein SCHCODRAFT_02097079 [Schizophyllum commune H4-8]
MRSTMVSAELQVLCAPTPTLSSRTRPPEVSIIHHYVQSSRGLGHILPGIARSSLPIVATHMRPWTAARHYPERVRRRPKGTLVLPRSPLRTRRRSHLADQ